MSRFVREEIANSITHGLGLVMSIGALPILIWMTAGTSDPWRIVACTVYGSTLILLYASSTLYHAFRTPRVKRLFQIFDYAAIYLLIAGTYTPFTLVNMRGKWGWALFGVVWGLAIIGVVATAVSLHISKYVSPAVCVAMGWLVLIAIKPLLATVSGAGVAWLVAGGVAYTAGVIFFAWESLPYGHAIWHCFVLAGSGCHFAAVLVAVVPAGH
ncbi:MAG TPA: hemolysin III family protein [Terriglobales bacterium]|nr:hemolysin III family protein [Terriglobales bacterium]